MRVALFMLVLILALAAIPSTVTARQEGTISVVDSKLGTDVQNRTIVGEDSTFALNSKVFLWLKIAGGNAETIKVTWKHESFTRETELTIGGDPWRTWANKNLTATGEWSVTVTDSKGTVLVEKKFTVHE